MIDRPVYVLDRHFKAPKPLVWRCWTDPELVARWYGPNVETVVHEMDVRPGGRWLVEMRFGGGSHFQKAEYTRVEAPNQLEWLHSSTDEDWNVVPSPMMKDWPQVLHTVVTFDEEGSGTRLRLTWEPHEASDAEVEAFRGALAGLDKGWGAGMELLADLLAEIDG